MSLNAYIFAYQLKNVFNAKTKISEKKYDTKKKCYIIEILLFF